MFNHQFVSTNFICVLFAHLLPKMTRLLEKTTRFLNSFGQVKLIVDFSKAIDYCVE